MASALAGADKDLYYKAIGSLPPQVRMEGQAFSKFFEKYRQSTASKVSGVVNDTSLKLQGTEGTKSYGMVTDLCVAYYISTR